MQKIWIGALAAGLMSAATLGFAGLLPAQESAAPANPPEQRSPGQRAGGNVENRLENLSKRLNLTDEQKEKIRPILKREMERIQEVRDNSSLTQGQARQRIAAIRKNTRQHIAEVLTPEQKKLWQQTQQERRGVGPGGPEPPVGPQNPPNPQ
jgi:Spy/CpxP family protein refolding chaperone